MVGSLKHEVGTPNPPTTITMESRVLGGVRRVYLQLPDDYAISNHGYPVLLVLDGEWLFELARSHVRFYSEFAAMGVEIPKMIVVGIENVDRDRDYVPTPDRRDKPQFPTAGEADRFLEFLRDELLPRLETDYRATSSRIIVGWSFGGLFALHAAVSMPELFRAYLCIGPSVWWDDEWVAGRFETAAFERPTRMVITVGSEENPGPVYDSTKRLLGRLRSHPIDGLEVTDFEFEGVGHGGGVPHALSRGLRALFPGYRMKVTEDTTIEKVETHYAHLSKRWGFDALPTPWVIQTLAANHWSAGREDEALRALDWYIERNPHESLIHAYRGIYLTRLGRRDDALCALHTALDLEHGRDVPSGVYLRGYCARIAEAERLPAA